MDSPDGWVQPTLLIKRADMTITTIIPATGAEIATYPLHTAADVDAALAADVAAQEGWREVPIMERVTLLRRVAEVLLANKDRYARLITTEMGKPRAEAVGEIEKCALNCTFYADNAPAFLADEVIASDAAEGAVVYDPLGIVLVIMPWNYLFWQFFRLAAPAFTAGNGAILKHANNTTGCALLCEEVVREVDAPDGLVHTIVVEPGDVAAIIADERIAAVTLTGSTEVGSILAAQAGRALKKQVLELNGSDPFIVLIDADVEEAARTAVKARFIDVGQSCANAKRFIVEERVADRFMALFCEGVAALRLGDPWEPGVTIGPTARANLRKGMHDQVMRSVAAGAELRMGGALVARDGFFYAPTVLDRVSPSMAAFDEETFDPVAAVIRVSDAAEALRLANRSECGFGASLWTRDVTGARAIARRLEAGAVFINGMVASDPRLPFGGIKRSGYGRELGAHGIREFTNIKTVWIGPAASVAAVTQAAPQ